MYNISALTIEFIIGIRTLGDLDSTKIAYSNGGLKACYDADIPKGL